MNNRVYRRIEIDVPSAFFITLNDNTQLEFDGIIHDISESGIQVRISKDNYEDLVMRLAAGDVIYFQAVDEYNVFNDSREDIIEGSGEVVWINSNDKEIVFGCRTNNAMPEYLSYVKNKKVSLFFSGNHEIDL